MRYVSCPTQCPAYDSPLPPRPSTVLAPVHSYVIGFLNKLCPLQLLGFGIYDWDTMGTFPSTS